MTGSHIPPTLPFYILFTCLVWTGLLQHIILLFVVSLHPFSEVQSLLPQDSPSALLILHVLQIYISVISSLACYIWFLPSFSFYLTTYHSWITHVVHFAYVVSYPPHVCWNLATIQPHIHYLSITHSTFIWVLASLNFLPCSYSAYYTFWIVSFTVNWIFIVMKTINFFQVFYGWSSC